ncbi:TnsA endonuclease N-terminal domain-containing protein [Herbaspirillum sp. GW103]|uniref:TnsA endonuclease N-terminal domain-containing protein n=1 Tax=Herbaspirillum sp. GW103 TaxID=1175306 RepID=UPI00192CB0A2|nr:TnsA endonuclease N-terminal domain-containing protein [Herbaspirillum sp. GW103]
MKTAIITRLDCKEPVRALKMSYRGITGRVSMHGGGRAHHESALERDWLKCLAFDPDVKSVTVQPFTMSYEYEGVVRTYTPDVLVERETPAYGAKIVVYELKFRSELKEIWKEFRPRFRAAVELCRANDWRFKIMTELEVRTPYLANAIFFRRYAALAPQKITEEQLLFSLKALGPTTPQALLAASYNTRESQQIAMPFLWRLIAHRRIAAMLDRPMSMHSAIWLPGV